MAALDNQGTTRGANRRPVLTEAERTAQRALDLLFRLSGRTDDECGKAAGLSRQTFYNRRRALARIRRGEEVQLAAVFDVDPACFSMTLEQLWQWLQNDPRGRDLLVAGSRCILLLAQPKAAA